MKEVFLATLLSMGPNTDNEVRLIEIATPVKGNTEQVTVVRNYVPGLTAADTRQVSTPHIVRHINAGR